MTKKEEKKIFKEIETVLYCYKKYEKKLEEYLEDLKNPTILNKYSLEYLGNTEYIEVKSVFERIEELKKRISNDVFRCEEVLFRIDSALEMIKDRDDYKFIEMRYMQGMTYEAIAEKLGVSTQSTYKMRNNILRALKIHFITQKLLQV